MHVLRLTPFYFFSTNQTRSNSRKLDKSYLSSARDGRCFSKRIINVWNSPPDHIVFFQKLSVGLRSKIKLISCIYRIIAATDCYIIFIARQHTDAQYWYSNSPRLSVCPSSISFCNAFYLVLANKRESNGINVIKSSAQRVPRNVSTVCWGYCQNQ